LFIVFTFCYISETHILAWLVVLTNCGYKWKMMMHSQNDVTYGSRQTRKI
jgi:hypothetical protein